MDTQKDVYMQEHSTQTEASVKPTQPIGKVDIHAAREGLAMVMDALRVMEAAGVKLTKAAVLYDGRICLLPAIEIPGHGVGISVMESGKSVFTVDGVSVMDKLPVMEQGK
jgi:hypothetical protein